MFSRRTCLHFPTLLTPFLAWAGPAPFAHSPARLIGCSGLFCRLRLQGPPPGLLSVCYVLCLLLCSQHAHLEEGHVRQLRRGRRHNRRTRRHANSARGQRRRQHGAWHWRHGCTNAGPVNRPAAVPPAHSPIVCRGYSEMAPSPRNLRALTGVLLAVPFLHAASLYTAHAQARAEGPAHTRQQPSVLPRPRRARAAVAGISLVCSASFNISHPGFSYSLPNGRNFPSAGQLRSQGGWVRPPRPPPLLAPRRPLYRTPMLCTSPPLLLPTPPPWAVWL